MNKIIFSPNAPKPVGAYSHAIEANGTLYLSGQIALCPVSGELIGQSADEQAEQICKNISAVLSSAGYDFENVVKTTCYLINMEDFAEFNSVYANYFKSKPARSCVAVKTLPKNAIVEIEVIAVK